MKPIEFIHSIHQKGVNTYCVKRYSIIDYYGGGMADANDLYDHFNIYAFMPFIYWRDLLIETEDL